MQIEVGVALGRAAVAAEVRLQDAEVVQIDLEVAVKVAIAPARERIPLDDEAVQDVAGPVVVP